MAGDDATRSALKMDLFQQVDALGRQQALLPFEGGPIDNLVLQLEEMNPTPNPLQVDHRQLLVGNWELAYASRGTVVTRKLPQLPNFFGEIQIQQVWQTLTGDDAKTIAAQNGALINFPLIGEWRLQADGSWIWSTDEKTATVSFGAFSFQAMKPFGQASWQLPELKIPVLEFLRNEALWITSYLDEDTRVGRGATGNLFVFRRS